MRHTNILKSVAFGLALTLAPFAASAAVVGEPFTTNDYSQINLADTLALPNFASWRLGATPSDRFGNSSGGFRSPFDETSDIGTYSNGSGVPEATEYWAVGPDNPDNPAILDFSVVQKSLSFLWGSPDSYNDLTFRLDGSDVGSFTGLNFPPTTFGSSFVTFTGLFDEVEFFSDGANAFEFTAISATPVPLPAGAVLILTGLGGFALMRRRKA